MSSKTVTPQGNLNRNVGHLDLLSLAIKNKWLIIVVAGISTMLSILIALLIPSVYMAKATFLPPSPYDVAVINTLIYTIDSPALEKRTPESMYNNFQTLLASQLIKRKVFDEYELIEDLSDKANNIAFEKYFDTYKITREKEVRGVQAVKLMQVSIQGENSEKIAEVINKIVKYADQKVIDNIELEIKKVIESKILFLKNNLKDLRSISETKLLDEVIRLSEEDEIARNDIKKNIVALRNTIKKKQDDKIIIFEEAAYIANKIGIVGDYPIVNDNLKIELVDHPKPLYYRGEEALKAEIQVVKNRLSHDPYISKLRDEQHKLELLNYNSKIKALKNRNSNDSFIENLRDKELELSKLTNIVIDTKGISAATIDQLAFSNSKRVKPRRSLIVVFGLLVGLSLGFILVIVLNYSHENPIKK